MFGWLRNVFKKEEIHEENPIKRITLGEKDAEGFCDTYINGEKTNLRMLVFTKNQSLRIQEIVDKIYKENEGKN